MTVGRSKKRSPLRRIKIWVWMVVMVLFIGELFFYTWCRVGCTRMGYEITRNQNRQQKNITTANSLKIELARLESPERIINKAKNEFGLVIPTSEQIMVLP